MGSYALQSNKFNARQDDLYYTYYRWVRRKKEENRNPFVPMRITNLELSDDIPFFLIKEASDPSAFIAGILARQITQQRQSSTGCCMLMPSISKLAEMFDVDLLTIEKTLYQLRDQGFDCLIPENRGDITLSIEP